jgi:hypothetical protein
MILSWNIERTFGPNKEGVCLSKIQIIDFDSFFVVQDLAPHSTPHKNQGY